MPLLDPPGTPQPDDLKAKRDVKHNRLEQVGSGIAPIRLIVAPQAALERTNADLQSPPTRNNSMPTR